MRTANRPLLGFLCLLPIVLVSAAACGGSVFDSREGSAGGNAVAGSSSAGSGSSSAGAGHGAAGASSGAAGSGAGGGTGSGGSGGLDLSACTFNSQCEVVPVGCCSCGASGPLSSYTAINSAYQDQFDARCGTIACEPCGPGTAPGLNDSSLYFVGICQKPADASPNAAGQCVVVDLRATEITACASANDCILRSGTGCCSGCGARPVAVNGSQAAALSQLVCGDEKFACPACAPNFDDYAASCSDGRCSVELSPCSVEHPCTR
ncbi:MAG: hypothetical protein WDO69_14450 [Pseudomonadota bacterium]